MNREKFILHTMGKVGSNTIRRTLRSLGKDAIRTHILTDDLRHDLLKYSEGLIEIGNIPYAKDLKSYVKRSRKISKEIKEYREKGNRLKVITVVREPLSHAISAFFMNIHYHMLLPKKCFDPKYYVPSIKYFLRWADYYTKPFSGKKIESQKKDVIRDLGEHYFIWPSLFVSTEIKKSWDIDLLSNHFEDGWDYKFYKTSVCDLMVIKYEKFECLTNAISELFNIAYNKITVINGNVSSNKFYGLAMKHFCDHIVFNESFIDKIYSTNYVKCFYSTNEIDGFKNKWLKGGH